MTPARHLLNTCSTSPRHMLDTSSRPTQHLLSSPHALRTSSVSARHLLVICFTCVWRVLQNHTSARIFPLGFARGLLSLVWQSFCQKLTAKVVRCVVSSDLSAKPHLSMSVGLLLAGKWLGKSHKSGDNTYQTTARTDLTLTKNTLNSHHWQSEPQLAYLPSQPTLLNCQSDPFTRCQGALDSKDTLLQETHTNHCEKETCKKGITTNTSLLSKSAAGVSDICSTPAQYLLQSCSTSARHVFDT